MKSGGVFPEQGIPWRTLEQELSEYQSGEMPYERGVFERYWPAYPDEAYLASRSAQSMFAHTNLFSMNALPSLKRVERELREMVGEILHVPEDGAVTLTMGGTESNFLAVKGARARGRAMGITRPNIVIPMTGHPSFDKAGDELGVDVRRIEVDAEFRAVPSRMRESVDENTILVAGSAPSYPQGVIDPIEELSRMAADSEVWMHVDACVGGFLLGALREVDPATPRFSLDIPGVWSVSADLHKFGLCLNGISTFSVRHRDLQSLHTYTLPEPGWPYRGYQRIGFAGSRPGSTIAAAWTTLRTLGREGYVRAAASIHRSARRLAEGIERIDGLRVDLPPEAGILVVFPEPEVDLESVSSAMLERAWDVSTALAPPSLHILLSPHMEHIVDPFLHDLREAVAQVRGEGPRATTAFTYGD
ncbi:pyridoxal phosphate-dependent decarboxylase family protein [Sinosporangium siamense]|uniref:Aspartate aminotransferase family protein n=1 Tax=Sinosporangium siamense TaxID=1367973 RepID=A0A919RHK6_9ACTN|nr:aminotransferase class V-fold PLP-dependent enzyme [Sinosporangium siamense]GII92945.1 aspartate aminotransferase family protein [Sinosporangium siamense]